MYTPARPSGVSLTKYVAFLWIEFGHPFFRLCWERDSVMAKCWDEFRDLVSVGSSIRGTDTGGSDGSAYEGCRLLACETVWNGRQLLRYGGTCCSCQTKRWKQVDVPKLWCLCTKVHGLASHCTAIVMTVDLAVDVSINCVWRTNNYCEECAKTEILYFTDTCEELQPVDIQTYCPIVTVQTHVHDFETCLSREEG